ncbi:MAG: acetyl-CoA acetyltransferase [Thermoleophilaceae bacterium]
MASHGIRDRVAIVGMGCTPFREHWGRSVDDLLVDAVVQCLASAQETEKDDVDAFWLGTYGSGITGMTLARPLKLENKPVTRVENACATGSESFRGACYAVASGAFDCVMATGVEKLKDSGYSGLSVPPSGDGTDAELTPPAMFSLLAPAYCKRYGLDEDVMREVLTRIAWKNHANGAKNELAQFRAQVTKEQITCAPTVAGGLGIFDCSGVADGAAAALIVRSEDAHRYTDRPLYVKALSMVAGSANGKFDLSFDYTTFPEVVRSAEDAYGQAGILEPRSAISLAEVHDCFTPTELVLMEDLGFSERGRAWQDVLAGAFDLDGELPVNPDGGLKSFGHPVGATGLRMLYENWLQMRGEAGERQLDSPGLGLTHNLGGSPGECVSFVSIVGAEPSA